MARQKKDVNETDKIKALEQQIEELKKLLLNQNAKQEVEVNTVAKVSFDEDDDNFEDIPPNKYIKVMSLTNHMLVLSTQGMGRGKVYVFNNFGEVKNIIYSDVADIIHNQERFAKEGAFYIMDKKVIHNHGLEDEYNKILNKKLIEQLLDFDNKTVKSMFSNATEFQKEIIVSLITEKIKKGLDIDLNKVNIISNVYGTNILELARNKNEDE